MLKEFDEAVKQRNELKEWWSLNNTIPQYVAKTHTLIIDFNNIGKIAFYNTIESKNYDAPKFFIDAFQKEAEYESWVLAARAYENEMERLTKIINQYKEEILKQLEEGN